MTEVEAYRIVRDRGIQALQDAIGVEIANATINAWVEAGKARWRKVTTSVVREARYPGDRHTLVAVSHPVLVTYAKYAR